MAKFYGKIGYLTTVETVPGVWEESIEERPYYGDVLNLSKKDQVNENLNDDITLNQRVSIVADPFAYENFYKMKYLEFLGTKWKITSVEVSRPRLILSAGGVYNDP